MHGKISRYYDISNFYYTILQGGMYQTDIKPGNIMLTERLHEKKKDQNTNITLAAIDFAGYIYKNIYNI